MSTLGNTFGNTSKNFGSGKNIWHEVKGSFPVGGSITNISAYKGKVIPAGSMCVLDQSAHTITIAKASEVKTATNTTGTVDPKTIKGLLYHDVYVENDTTYATGNVVFAGEIYADRLEESIPDEVWAVLPMIVPIHEA